MSKQSDWPGQLTYETTIPLPYVEGRETLHTDMYDDSVDVLIEQCARGTPFATLIFDVPGPVVFKLLGWGPKELRALAAFLTEAADHLDRHNPVSG